MSTSGRATRHNIERFHPMRALWHVTRVGIALAFLAPAFAFALTGGPSEPAASGPTAVGVDNLVDPFTGDFQYAIPLVELPGPRGSYAFSMSYRSGIQTDAEASWVGLGWTFEPGRISRSVRGAPDDVNGDDAYQLFRQRPAITVGGGGSVGIEAFGLDSRLLSAGASVGLEIFFDTYSGYGMALNLSPKASVALSDNLSADLGVRADLNTHHGTTVGANVGLNIGMIDLSPSFGGTFSSRTGLESAYWAVNGSGAIPIPLFAPSYLATQQRAQHGDRYDVSVKVGGALWGVFLEGSANGYYSETEYSMPARRRVFGYLHLHEANGAADDPQLDFTREKDAPLKPKTPQLPFTIPTSDAFDIGTSGGPSGQFRAYRNDLPTFGDPSVASQSVSRSGAMEAGLGAYAHFGGSYQTASAESASSAWTDNDFARAAASALAPALGERVYFAMASDASSGPVAGLSSQTDRPSYVELSGATTARAKLDQLPGMPTMSSEPRARANFIRAVTERDATTEAWRRKFAHAGIERPAIASNSDRIAGFDIVSPDGTHYVFAQPAYVTREINCSFSVDPAPGADASQIAQLFPGQGTIKLPSEVASAVASWTENPSSSPTVRLRETTDNFISCSTTPAYAHSYYLTSILGPEYVDSDAVEGPSDGDLGHWVRFSYEAVKDYAYRSPFVGAHYSRGQEHSYLVDDRASFIYGRKDLYFLTRAWTASHEVKFTLATRADARGAASVAQNDVALGDVALKRLSQLDLYRIGDPAPIKTVKLDHSYQLAPGVPNRQSSSGSPASPTGKLTLEKLSFEHETDRSGGRSPYTFTYALDSSDNPNYQHVGRHGDRNSDRWGYYQSCDRLSDYPEASEPDDEVGTSGARRCSNTELPYTRQGVQADNWAGAWSLRSIQTPPGTKISVEYEADDYAYVQSERAAVMISACDGVIDATDSTPELCIRLWEAGLSSPPSTKPEAESFVARMLQSANGTADQIAFSADLKLRQNRDSSCGTGRRGDADKDIWGNVAGYVEVRDVNKPFRIDDCPGGKCTAHILLRPAPGGFHPLAFAGWQHLRTNQPQYGVPGVTAMDVREMSAKNDGAALAQAADGLVNMVLSFHETFSDYFARAAGACWASEARHPRVRLFDPSRRKKGGGARVKKVTLCDAPPGSTVDCTDPRYVVGRTYRYDVKEDGSPCDGTMGNCVSSGVAAYEPALGGDEISLRRAEFFDDEHLWAPNDPTYVEQPVGESLFPGPVVGYRRVEERTLAGEYAKANPNQGVRTAGARVYEFYTAKDFPVRTRASIVQKPEPVQQILQMYGIGTILHEQFAASQGYRIELNDMHGKPRRVAEYLLTPEGAIAPGADRETHFTYNVSGDSASRLDPSAVPIYHQGAKLDAALGERVEYYADMRQSRTSTNSMGVSMNTDTIFVIYAMPIPAPWPSYDDSVKESRTSVFHEVLHRNAILLRTDVRDGSGLSSTTNLAFDRARGAAILTAESNAFGEAVYDFQVPAHWLHPDLGPAYVSETRPNLLTANAVLLKSSSDPLQAPAAACCDPSYVTTRRVSGVLDAGMTLFWNRDLLDEALFFRHAPAMSGDAWMYTRGDRGPWHPVASYKVDARRVNAVMPSPRTDGGYDIPVTIPLSELPKDPVGVFEGLVRSCGAGWYETERFQRYHPRGPAVQSGTPLERRDALVYGRRAAVVQAVAMNATYYEIGYEGFEYYPSGKEVEFDDLDDGNIDFWADPTKVPTVWTTERVPGRIKDGALVWEALPKKSFGRGDIDPLPPDARVSIDAHTGDAFTVAPILDRVERRDGRDVGIPREPLPFSDRDVLVELGWLWKATPVEPSHFRPKGPWPWFKDLVEPDPRVEVSAKTAHTGSRSLAVHGNVAFRQTRLFNSEDLQQQGGTYVLGAWVSQDVADVATFTRAGLLGQRLGIGVVLGGQTTDDGDSTGGKLALFEPVGPVIDGWQRIEGEFEYSPGEAVTLIMQSGTTDLLYVDDIRVHPKQASFQAFVYEPRTLRLVAKLDENNFGARWQYDHDGQLRFVERETERGWRTVTEHMVHQAEYGAPTTEGH